MYDVVLLGSTPQPGCQWQMRRFIGKFSKPKNPYDNPVGENRILAAGEKVGPFCLTVDGKKILAPLDMVKNIPLFRGFKRFYIQSWSLALALGDFFQPTIHQQKAMGDTGSTFHPPCPQLHLLDLLRSGWWNL